MKNSVFHWLLSHFQYALIMSMKYRKSTIFYMLKSSKNVPKFPKMQHFQTFLVLSNRFQIQFGMVQKKVILGWLRVTFKKLHQGDSESPSKSLPRVTQSHLQKVTLGWLGVIFKKSPSGDSESSSKIHSRVTQSHLQKITLVVTFF